MMLGSWDNRAPRYEDGTLNLPAIEQRTQKVASRLEALRREGDPSDPDLPGFIKSGEAAEMALDAIVKSAPAEKGTEAKRGKVADEWWRNSSKWLSAAKYAPTATHQPLTRPEDVERTFPFLWVLLGLFLGVPAVLAIGATIVSLL